MCVCVCVCVCYLKSSNHYTEKRTLAEHFCCSNTLLLLIKREKLIQTSVLILWR